MIEQKPHYKQMTYEERFYIRVNKTDQCWLWIGAKFPKGYGMMRKTKGNVDTAHRISWEIHHGPIPPGMSVCHRCDNKLCVNPDHLFLGTHQDNMRDMVQKGRSAKGEKNSHYGIHQCGIENGRSKLTNDQVLDIRQEFNQGLSVNNLATKYQITKTNIRYIIKRLTWTHI